MFQISLKREICIFTAIDVNCELRFVSHDVITKLLVH